MGTLDGALGGVAQTLIRTFGRSATLIRPGSSGSFDTASLTITGAGSPTSYSCFVVFAEYTQSQIDGTLIKAGDRKAVVSRLALGVEPLPQSDTLYEGGRTWQIISLIGYSSGEQEAAYELQVRR